MDSLFHRGFNDRRDQHPLAEQADDRDGDCGATQERSSAQIPFHPV
jgi:hypothetical protein